MKKLFSVCFLSVCLLAFGVFSKANFFAVSADDFWYYEISEGQSTANISGVKDLTITDLVVPDALDGYSVVKLSANSEEESGRYYGFTSESYKNLITSLDLTQANNLTEIDREVFQDCVNLAGDIYLPDSILTVGRNAFYGTQINRVFVSSPSVITINSTSFPATVEVIYASDDLMNMYLADNSADTDWQAFTSKYLYNIVLNIDGTTKTLTTTQIQGDKFGDNYDVIMQYLSGYDVKSVNQGGDELSANLLASGDEINVELNEPEAEAEVLTTQQEITYGEILSVLTESVNGATYHWKWENEEIENSTNELSYAGLTAGNYTAICEVKVGEQVVRIETFNIVVKKADYIITYPSKNNFEYFEFSSQIFISNFNLDEVDAVFYFKSQEVEIFNEIGEYVVEVSLKETLTENYEITNPTFKFYLVEEELTISWPTNTYNYTGSLVVPQYSVVGNTWGYDVQLNFSNDSCKSAIDVGHYTIKVEGVSSKYFKLSTDTITTFNWQIVSTELTIRWELNTFDYTSSQILPVVYGENGNIKIALNVISSTGDTNFVDANVYDVIAQLPEEYTGFTLQGENTNTLTINPVRLDVVFTSSDSYMYNGEYIEVEAEITTPITEEVNLILSGHRFKDAGNYTAVVDGVDNSNYYVDDNITFDWTINKKVLVVNWIPNVQPLSFVYNGSVQIPRATVNTGINGETLTLELVTDYNKYANEDATQGYLVTAKLSDDVKNYSLTNNSIRYRINRAQAVISVGAEYSVPYNGENQLPDYQFVGDEGALKFTINGVEVTNGVKEPGTYEVLFSSVQSQNYYASLEGVTCLFTIMPISVSGTSEDGKLTVSAADSNGIEVEDLPVETIKDFDTSLLNDVENIDNYYFYKAVLVGRYNESLSENTKLTFELNNKGRDVRIFLITSNGLQELAATIEDGKVMIDGRQGEYVILVEKQNWWTSIAGITTISTIIFAVVVAGLLVAIMSRPKKFEIDKQVNLELEKTIKQKAYNGENLTAEDIKRLRKEIKNKINKDKSTKK